MEDDDLSTALGTATTAGEQLRIIRTHAGYTLRALARKFNLDKSYISRVEHGHVPPPVGATWTRYERVLLEPFTESDRATVRQTLVDITNMAALSTAAINQVLRDYPTLSTLVLNTARAGLTEEEQQALGDLVLRQSKRVAATPSHTIATHGHPILRERRSSAKAKECPG